MKDNLSLVHFAHHDLQDVGVGVGVHHDRIGCTWARALLRPWQVLDGGACFLSHGRIGAGALFR